MGRFDFVSPGAAITDSLTRTLAERKARERQNLLDTLATNADNRAADQAQREDEWRKAQSDNMQRDDELKQVGMIGNMLMPGDDPEAAGMDPKLIELGKKWGQFTPAPPAPGTVPDIAGQNGPTNKPRYQFAGNQKQREELRQQKEDAETVTSLLANPTTAAIGQKMQVLMKLGHGKLPTNATDLLKDDTVTPYIFDDTTGKILDGTTRQPITGALHGKYVVEHQPRAPQGPQPPNPIPTGALDDQHRPMFMDPRTHQTFPATGGTKPIANDETSLGVPSDIRLTHQNAASQLTPITHWFKPNDDVDPTALATFRQSATSVIGAAKVSPKVKDLARLFIRNPAAYQAKIADMATQGTDLTPREVSELGMLKDSLAGPDQTKLLTAHVIQ